MLTSLQLSTLKTEIDTEGGNQLFENTLTTSQTVNNGATPSFGAGSLSITFTIAP